MNMVTRVALNTKSATREGKAQDRPVRPDQSVGASKLVVAVEELRARHCGVPTMRRRRGSEEIRLVCRRRFDRVGWLVVVDWEVNLLEDPLIWGGLNSKFKAISPIIKNHTILIIGICASAARAVDKSEEVGIIGWRSHENGHAEVWG